MKTIFIATPNEAIAPIIGFESLYLVTDLGKILSTPKVQNGNQLIEKKATIDSRGYYRVCVGSKGIKSTLKVHRVVAQAFCPNPHNLKEVNHIDCNKLNNAATNLEWASRKGNMEHAAKNGLLCIREGEKNSFAKLNEQKVREIFSSKEAILAIAEKYGIKPCTVYDIKSGRCWKHLSLFMTEVGMTLQK